MTSRSRKAVAIAALLAGSLFSSAHSQPVSGAPAPAGTGAPAALGSTWADAAKMPDLFSGTWMTGE